MIGCNDQCCNDENPDDETAVSSQDEQASLAIGHTQLRPFTCLSIVNLDIGERVRWDRHVVSDKLVRGQVGCTKKFEYESLRSAQALLSCAAPRCLLVGREIE